MGKSKKPVIIELTGFPGVGKTTVSSKLSERYGQELNLSDYINFFSSGESGVKNYIKFLKDGDLVQLFNLACYLASIRRLKSIKYVLKNVYIFTLTYKSFCKNSKYSYTLSDDSMIQAITLLNFPEKFVLNKYSERIFKRLFSRFEIVAVNCICDKEICMERLIERNHSKGRFDKIDKNNKEELKRVLGNFEESLEIVRNYLESIGVKQINLDMTATPEENAEIIYKNL